MNDVRIRVGESVDIQSIVDRTVNISHFTQANNATYKFAIVKRFANLLYRQTNKSYGLNAIHFPFLGAITSSLG